MFIFLLFIWLGNYKQFLFKKREKNYNNKNITSKNINWIIEIVYFFYVGVSIVL